MLSHKTCSLLTSKALLAQQMTFVSIDPQTTKILLLGLALASAFFLFIWDRWRYDVVAVATLLFLTLCDVIPVDQAFTGFSHPAVATVIAVLILSRGIQNSGLLEFLARGIQRASFWFPLQLLLLCMVTAILSAFINNVGALAVVMPLTLRAARLSQLSPSLYLMPVAFSSLLGGLTTLIGTPPNIIVSTVRAQNLGSGFQLFDFTAVGLLIASAGILMIVSFGWRFIPLRQTQTPDEAGTDIGTYTTELTVPAKSKAIGMSFSGLQKLVDGELVLLVWVNKAGKRQALRQSQELKQDDILVIEGPPEAISSLMDKVGMHIAADQKLKSEVSRTEEHLIGEAVVSAGSSLVGRMPRAATLRRRYGVAMLAVARQGRRLRARFSQIRLRAGDVLLLRGEAEDVDAMMRDFGCLPLAERDIQVGLTGRSYLSFGIFLSTMALTMMQLIPVQLAFAVGAVAMVATAVVPARTVYSSIEWSVVILIGAFLPVGQAIESTGAADLMVRNLLYVAGSYGPTIILAALMVSVMLMSDVINNAAAAALAAPVAVRLSTSLDASPDAFLMAVAVGASCTFLTPIGHQSNTLVMGPGRYQFSDYWRLGLPMDIVVVCVGIPAILFFWPLYP